VLPFGTQEKPFDRSVLYWYGAKIAISIVAAPEGDTKTPGLGEYCRVGALSGDGLPASIILSDRPTIRSADRPIDWAVLRLPVKGWNREPVREKT